MFVVLNGVINKKLETNNYLLESVNVVEDFFGIIYFALITQMAKIAQTNQI